MSRTLADRIALVTDFGDGIYVGQMRARLQALMPSMPQVDLVQDLPAFRPDLAAYLLPALARDMPARTLYLCVVDPGVGGDRSALVLQVDDDWLLGPDNGLFAPMILRSRRARVWRIGWRPEALSASFHGRDWFAPAAARLCRAEDLGLEELNPSQVIGADWPADLDRVIYVDRYGNCLTGMRAPVGTADQVLPVGPHLLKHARTFCEVAPGEAFWYENALGLVEVAVNQGRADAVLGLVPGDRLAPLIPSSH
ncbi:SAM-dependent chlorinase/fluorinase [Thiorhodococcus mannitoliphagus]|uniref:SAM-dependent chlorinase/fluorinase n=1 Tax=Thiorhodococcus mannitoliphagus TaxID=329406 RepID=A0A6P1DPK4_9GAMM|nr:SAM-dependent chlorinase/fluorinase [Thiorhodococcus mannitoliphagus]NEX19083.1 SAM-dependent chlorinase/fluorinase [Thiorhodococcus mannitoliphagus]